MHCCIYEIDYIICICMYEQSPADRGIEFATRPQIFFNLLYHLFFFNILSLLCVFC